MEVVAALRFGDVLLVPSFHLGGVPLLGFERGREERGDIVPQRLEPRLVGHDRVFTRRGIPAPAAGQQPPALPVCGRMPRVQAHGSDGSRGRRFAGEGGFARFNGTAPLPASSAEGDDEPKRPRRNRGGNGRINAVLHRMAVTQLRCELRARQIYDDAPRNGHTKKEAMRILKRHVSNVVYRRMIRDLNATLSSPPVDTRQAAA